MGEPIKQFYQWYMSKSVVSRSYFTLSLLLFVLMYFNFVTIEQIYIDYQSLSKLQLWRLLTALVYEHSYSLLSYPFKAYISYSILVNFEERLYTRANAKSYAEFLWLIMSVWTVVNIITVVFGFYVTNHFFFLCLCFIWAKKTPNSSLNLTMGISIPVYYLPYIYAIYYWIFGLVGFWYQLVVAFAMGYVYYYLKIYSMTHYNKDYFPTPKIFELLVEKYLILEKKFSIVKQYQFQQQEQDDPYGQYGYYTHQQHRNKPNNNQQQEQQPHSD